MSTLSVQNIVGTVNVSNIIVSNISTSNVFTSNVVINGTNISAFDSAYKNKIINGNFDIWQRGTSNGMSGYFTADRWYSENVGSTKVASQQSFTLGQTAVPGEPTYFMRHVVTTSAGAGNGCFIQQPIESARTLAGKTATLSFWAKADSSKNICSELYQFFGTGGSPSATVTGIGVKTFALTSSWQKFTSTFSVPSISGKTLGSDSNDLFAFAFWFDAGSNLNSRTNNLGQQSGTFDIAQVQVEEGPVATAFEQRHLGQELALCQRYYEKSYNASACSIWDGPTTSGTYATAINRFSVTKRTSATVTLVNNYNSNFTTTVGSIVSCPEGFTEQRIANATGSRGYWGSLWTADAEL